MTRTKKTLTQKQREMAAREEEKVRVGRPPSISTRPSALERLEIKRAKAKYLAHCLLESGHTHLYTAVRMSRFWGGPVLEGQLRRWDEAGRPLKRRSKAEITPIEPTD